MYGDNSLPPPPPPPPEEHFSIAPTLQTETTETSQCNCVFVVHYFIPDAWAHRAQNEATKKKSWKWFGHSFDDYELTQMW